MAVATKIAMLYECSTSALALADAEGLCEQYVDFKYACYTFSVYKAS